MFKFHFASIDHSSREVNRLALTIDRLIWDHSISLGKLVNSRWNLIFILHHEIIWLISTLLAPHYRYPNRGSFFRPSKSIKSNSLFVDLGIHIESPVLHIIVRTVAICCNLFSKPISKRVYYSSDPYIEIKQLDYLLSEIHELLSTEGIISPKFTAVNLLSQRSIVVKKNSFLNYFHFPRILFTGAKAHLDLRLFTCNCLNYNSFVVSTTHGNHSNALFHEPIFSYSEHTACNMLIEYGKSDLFQLNSPSSYRPNQIIFRSSSYVKKALARSSWYSSQDPDPDTIYYIPTSLSGPNYYFPYRQVPDFDYLSFWSFLLSSNDRIQICLHPKMDTNMISSYNDFLDQWSHRVCLTSLSDLLQLRSNSHFITDYISSVISQLISHRKLILFFDLGLRNYTPSYSKQLINYTSFVSKDTLEDIDALALARILAEFRFFRHGLKQQIAHSKLIEYSVV